MLPVNAELAREKERQRRRETDTEKEEVVAVCCVLNVPATCECISGTDFLNFTCCHTEKEVEDKNFHLTH